MKTVFKIIFFSVFIFSAIAFTPAAKADGDPANINLVVEAPPGTLFKQPITVTACETSPGSGIFTINGYCALEQTGLATTTDWSFWGDDAFLNSIGKYANNQDNNGVYWQWFTNFEYGQTALNKHILADNENLLLAYGNLLRISASDLSPLVNATTTISIEEFGLDQNWNPVWQPAASSTILLDSGQEFFSESGSFDLLVSTTTPFVISAQKDGFLASQTLILSPKENPAPANNENPPENNGIENTNAEKETPAGNGGGGGGAPQIIHQKFDINKAINFLLAKQNTNGSFDSIINTDWAAMALAAFDKNMPASKKIKNYLLSDPNPRGGLNSASDYARRAMALMALNINPYSGIKTNYIQKITDSFDSKQFGDPDIYNDDIFAVLVLSKAGLAFDDEMIKKTIAFIISNQLENGSFSTSDLTSAAIEAFMPYSSQPEVAASIQKARNFLFSIQASDGGFGNSFSTSWVIQAIHALGENNANWVKNNNTPQDYLFKNQAPDGGLEADSPDSARIWATSYAIPAALNISWLDLLFSFNREAVSSGSAVPNSSFNNLNEKTNASSTLIAFPNNNENPNFPASPNGPLDKKILESPKTENGNNNAVASAPQASLLTLKNETIPKITKNIVLPKTNSSEKKQNPITLENYETSTPASSGTETNSTAQIYSVDILKLFIKYLSIMKILLIKIFRFFSILAKTIF
jgi:hypothetical protein